MRRIGAAVTLLLGLTLSPAAAGAALCAGPPSLLLVDFAPGSADLPAEAMARHAAALRAEIGDPQQLRSYHVSAMGELAAGPAWDAAPVAARLADQALARARGVAVQRLLARLPRELRTSNVSARLLPNRPDFSGWDGSGPTPSPRTGVIVQVGLQRMDANGVILAC